MKHRDENLPVLMARGGEILDPMDRQGAIAELNSEERKRYFVELRETARQVSREVVSLEDTFSVGEGRGMDQGGVQSLATYFNLETWSDEPTAVWTENRPFLRAHRNNEDLPPTVAPVAEHVSVRVVGHVRTPWGHHVMRSGSCSSRGKHFWHSKRGQFTHYNIKKYREGAEHICAGIAETRAIARAVKAALMIGSETWKDSEFDEEKYQERKREKAEATNLEALSEAWGRKLRALEVPPEEEEAFRLAMKDLPDDEDDWRPEHYEFALSVASRKGRPIFRTARQKVRPEPPEDDGRAPPGGESNKRAGADPDEAPERAETEASESSEPAEKEEETERQEEPPEDPALAKKKRSLLTSIEGVCKMLGEDRTRAEQYAGDKWGDGTPIPLEELSVDDLDQVDRALSAELSAGGAS